MCSFMDNKSPFPNANHIRDQIDKDEAVRAIKNQHVEFKAISHTILRAIQNGHMMCSVALSPVNRDPITLELESAGYKVVADTRPGCWLKISWGELATDSMEQALDTNDFV